MEPATHLDHADSRYHKQVYQCKRADLLKNIHTALQPLFYNQLKNLSRLTVIRFREALGAGLKAKGALAFVFPSSNIARVNFDLGTVMTLPKSSLMPGKLVSSPSSWVRGRRY